MDKIIVVTEGEYSDYCVLGIFKMLKPLDPEAEAIEYLKVNPADKKPYSFQNDKFLLWLIERGYLEQIEAPQWGELHMPDYGSYRHNNRPLTIHDGWGFLR